MAGQFNVGEVVTLKSGGPLMTIRKIESAQALCDWFDAKKERQTQYFDLSTLRPAKAD